ncbi:MAG: hypothetical protein LBC76_08380 [Treponema sp.]|jgi:hypothetical protein|nr:hypothetical protein [Treponema sp.]
MKKVILTISFTILFISCGNLKLVGSKRPVIIDNHSTTQTIIVTLKIGSGNDTYSVKPKERFVRDLSENFSREIVSYQLSPINYLMVLFEKAPLAFLLDDWEKLLPWNIFTA